MGRATLYIIIADFFLGADFSHASWLGFAVVLVVTGASMGAIGIVLAAAVLVLKRAELLSVLVMLAISTFGGAVFPVSVFPDWLENITRIIPARYAFDGVRAALFRGDGWAGDAALLASIAAVTLPVSLLAFSAALTFAKRRVSSLAIY